MEAITLKINKRGLNILQVALDHMAEHMNEVNANGDPSEMPFFDEEDLALVSYMKKQLEDEGKKV